MTANTTEIQHAYEVAGRIIAGAAIPKCITIRAGWIHIDGQPQTPEDREDLADLLLWLSENTEGWRVDTEWMHCRGHVDDFRSFTGNLEGVRVSAYEYRLHVRGTK